MKDATAIAANNPDLTFQPNAGPSVKGTRAAFAVRYLVANLLIPAVFAAMFTFSNRESSNLAGALMNVAGPMFLLLFSSLTLINLPFVALASRLSRLERPYSYLSVYLWGYAYWFAVVLLMGWWLWWKYDSEIGAEFDLELKALAAPSAIGGLFLTGLYYAIAYRRRREPVLELASEAR